MNVEGIFQPEKTICKFRWSYPIFHVSRGELRTCDKTLNIPITEQMLQDLGTDAFLNNPYLIERRREKLHGLRHSDCFTCIKLEDKGVNSTRTGATRFTDYINKQVGVSGSFEDFKYSMDPRLLRADHPEILEISLSNICNLKCIYCSPTFSTLWEDESIKYGELKEEHRERNTLAPPSFEPYFWKWFDKVKNSLQRIIFIGGEPLLQKDFYTYLETIDEKMRQDPNLKNRRFIINIISNFNIPDPLFDRFLSILGNLSENYVVHVESSVEAFAERAEYIRYGLKWSQMEKNIRKLLALNLPNVRFGLQMAINNLCLSSLPDLLRFANTLQEEYNMLIDFKENIVMAPEYLCPLILSADFASYLDESIRVTEELLANPAKTYRARHSGELSHTRWQIYLPFLKSIREGILRQESASPHLKKEFYQFITRNDQRRDTNFRKTFPEYVEFLELCAIQP